MTPPRAATFALTPLSARGAKLPVLMVPCPARRGEPILLVVTRLLNHALLNRWLWNHAPAARPAAAATLDSLRAQRPNARFLLIGALCRTNFSFLQLLRDPPLSLPRTAEFCLGSRIFLRVAHDALRLPRWRFHFLRIAQQHQLRRALLSSNGRPHHVGVPLRVIHHHFRAGDLHLPRALALILPRPPSQLRGELLHLLC
mmetsp:Transcript_22610/g.56159  ORF Transcript_22610/g.56159 Transcript_22610/m.56159 type:complete len:200 (-) Transcript_22610:1038-1637(-)